jgi:hypothetical protein
MSKSPDHVLLARFRLNRNEFRSEEISVLDYAAWDSVLNEFTAGIVRARGKDLRDFEKPPVRRLNYALSALSPQLIHAFEVTNYSPFRRQLLALNRNDIPLPTGDNLRWATSIWAMDWARLQFEQFFDSAAGHRWQDLMARLQNGLNSVTGTWSTVSAYHLIEQAEDDLRYQAIPSFLAYLLNGMSITIDGRAVTFRLAQQEKKLVAVSDPCYSDYSTPSNFSWHGTFAYVIEFAIQTQAGTHEPWIHLYLSCRRYPDKKVTKFNNGRQATIMVGTTVPRRAGWNIMPTLIPLPVNTNRGRDALDWDDRLPGLLEQLQARALIDPRSIFTDPSSYRVAGVATNQDEYLPIYVEGMKPKHILRTGFGVQERAEVVQAVAEVLDRYLIPGNPLPRDTATLRAKKNLTLANRATLVEKLKSEERAAAQLRQALKRALRDKPLHLAICWSSERTRDALRAELRNLFAVEEGQPYPGELVVNEQYVEGGLIGPLDPGNLDPADCFDRNRPGDFWSQWYEQMKKAKLERIEAWKTIWKVLGDLPIPHAVIIELPEPNPDLHWSQSPKGAIREACLTGWQACSQMLYPSNPELDEEGEDTGEDEVASQARVKNGLADLIIRQTGVLFDRPATLYREQAGLPEDIAKSLTVIGLYHVRGNQTREQHHRLDFAIAVRIAPEGLVEACLPNVTDGRMQQWQPYHETAIKLGTLFARQRGALILKSESLLTFAREVVLEKTSNPTLVLVDANGWRDKRIWPQLQNARLETPNQLDLNAVNAPLNPMPVITPAKLPNLRVIRLREKGGNGETPQYVATVASATWREIDTPKSIGAAAAFIDTESDSPFFHYYSIADQPQSARWQKPTAPKHALGGRMAFKYQTILEIVPLFLQPGDDPIHWSRVAHFLRRAPAWSGGGIVWPYPIHLGKVLIEDLRCVLGSDS